MGINGSRLLSIRWEDVRGLESTDMATSRVELFVVKDGIHTAILVPSNVPSNVPSAFSWSLGVVRPRTQISCNREGQPCEGVF